MSIRTSSGSDGYVRMAYEYVNEDDGSPATTTTRLIEAHTRTLDKLDWTSLLGE